MFSPKSESSPALLEVFPSENNSSSSPSFSDRDPKNTQEDAARLFLSLGQTETEDAKVEELQTSDKRQIAARKPGRSQRRSRDIVV